MTLTIEKSTASPENEERSVCLDDNRLLTPQLPKYERDPVPAVVIETDFGARDFGMDERRNLRKMAMVVSRYSRLDAQDALALMVAIEVRSGVLPEDNAAEALEAELKAHSQDVRNERLASIHDQHRA